MNMSNEKTFYVSELYEDILNYTKLGADTKALEIGIGCGQATYPILETGADVLAIDKNADLVAYSAEKFAENKNFKAKAVKFEDLEAEAGSFDFIYSATAFHEIPTEAGYKKAYDLLKEGGVFARFANHPFKDPAKHAMGAAMQTLYNIYMPSGAAYFRPYSEARAEKRAELAEKYGFTDIFHKRYFRTRTYTADEYVAYLKTDADYLEVEEGTREKFFHELVKLINRFGGTIRVVDTMQLQLARKQ